MVPGRVGSFPGPIRTSPIFWNIPDFGSSEGADLDSVALAILSLSDMTFRAVKVPEPACSEYDWRLMPETSLGGPNVRFQPTLWTTVLRARDAGGEEARGAIGRLVERYWKPLYFFARRRGCDVENAKDLTQAFFGRVVERDFLRDVTPEKGRFRSWLLAAMSHFLSDERERENALKRGG